jgi:hypothetical protein
VLVPEQFQVFRRRADERHSGRGHRLRETRVLRKEAISRVDRACARPDRGFNDQLDIEIGVRAREMNCVVRKGSVRRGAVSVGVHGDGPKAQGLGRPHDPGRDLAPVGDQDRVERIRIQGCIQLCTPGRIHVRQARKRMFLLASPTVSGMFPGVTGISGSALHGTCLLPDILGISAECEIPDGGGVDDRARDPDRIARDGPHGRGTESRD